MKQSPDETLYDYRNRLPWLENLGWSDEMLLQIPVHREQNLNEPFVSLLVRSLRGPEIITGLYVYKSEVSADIWDSLSRLTETGTSSGREREPITGPDKELDNIPREY